MCLILVRAFVLGLLVACSVGAEKWWPDFSCYPFKDSPDQEQFVSFHRMVWRNCVEKNEKYKEGNCPKVCKLVYEKLVYQKEKPDGPVIFDTDKFVAYFADELGYEMDKPEMAEKQRMDKIRSGIDQCKKKYPDYEGLKNLKTAVCEPWNNLLQCVEKAVAC